MKFIKKNYNWLLVVFAFVALVAGVVIAQDLDSLESTYSTTWTRAYRNVEVGLPETAQVPYFFVKMYDIDISRITGAAGTYDTLIDIPDNAVITEAYVDVTTAFLPATNTVALQMNTANDILSASTNLNATGIIACVPVATAATAVKATAARDFSVVFAGSSSLTTGVARVVLKGFQGK